jgi:hypothetical protein
VCFQHYFAHLASAQLKAQSHAAAWYEKKFYIRNTTKSIIERNKLARLKKNLTMLSKLKKTEIERHINPNRYTVVNELYNSFDTLIQNVNYIGNTAISNIYYFHDSELSSFYIVIQNSNKSGYTFEKCIDKELINVNFSQFMLFELTKSEIEKHINNDSSAKIVFVSSDGNEAAINVIFAKKETPVLVYFKNTKKFTLGQTIVVAVSQLKVVAQVLLNNNIKYIFTIGKCNFKIVPEFYKAKIVYVSKSGKSGAVSVIVEYKKTPVLAFFQKKEFRKEGDIINFPTNLKVVPITKKDGSVFYFIQLGICNFTIAPNKTQKYFSDDSYSHYDEAQDDCYEKSCPYCDEKPCACSDRDN